MATRKTTTKSRRKTTSSTTTGFPLSESLIEQIADSVVRTAISEQARDLEKHLHSIHERLVALESKR